MNYLAHGFRFLDSPLMVAGTAVPDWLSVVDRRVRVRSRRIHEQLDSLDADLRTIAEGMLQHLHDDDLFHRSVRFVMLESELSSRFRRIMPDRFDHRPPLLGHIVIELLLDDFIAQQMPEVLDALLLRLCRRFQLCRFRKRSTPWPRARRIIWPDSCSCFEPHSFCTTTPMIHSLLRRLNQVMKRVTLPSLDCRLFAGSAGCAAIVDSARRRIAGCRRL